MPDNPHVLVVRRRYLGDIVLLGSFLRNLRLHWPTARIHVLVQADYADVLALNPDVDGAIALPRRLRQWPGFLLALRRLRCTHVFNLDNTERTALLTRLTGAPFRLGLHHGGYRLKLAHHYTHVVNDPNDEHEARPITEYYLCTLAAAGVPVATREVRLVPREADLAFLRPFVGAGGPVLLVHPGSRSPWRIWPADRFAAVCDRAQDELGVHVVLVGGPGDGALIEEIRRLARSHLLTLPRAAVVAPLCRAGAARRRRPLPRQWAHAYRSRRRHTGDRPVWFPERHPLSSGRRGPHPAAGPAPLPGLRRPGQMQALGLLPQLLREAPDRRPGLRRGPRPVGPGGVAGMNPPLITFGIPAYNRPGLLAEALRSIAAQTAAVDYEVVICDDGCLAETRRAAEQFPEGRCRYLANRPPLGAVGNWNYCLRAARGQWVMVLHEDDALYPWYLASVLPRLRDGLAAVCTQTVQGAVPPELAPTRGRPAVAAYPPRYFLKSSMTPFPGVLVRREVAERLGGFDERWGPLADYEFWYRLACAGPVEVVRVPAAFYRVSPGQWTERTWARMLRLTHLLRLRIAREQFPSSPRWGRWLARFFTFRNARSYFRRFAERPADLRRALRLGKIPLAFTPSGWVWQALKLTA